jgi:predicted nucleic acid-binding protein
MTTDCFLDTNVLVYAAAGRVSEPRKHEIARELVLAGGFGVSAQSLAEFVNAVTRKAKNKMKPADIDIWIDELSDRPLAVLDEAMVRGGIHISRRYGISYYDAALLAAAERLGARVFYSEDLNHNQAYGPVRVVNPFLEH